MRKPIRLKMKIYVGGLQQGWAVKENSQLSDESDDRRNVKRTSTILPLVYQCLVSEATRDFPRTPLHRAESTEQ